MLELSRSFFRIITQSIFHSTGFFISPYSKLVPSRGESEFEARPHRDAAIRQNAIHNFPQIMHPIIFA